MAYAMNAVTVKAEESLLAIPPLLDTFRQQYAGLRHHHIRLFLEHTKGAVLGTSNPLLCGHSSTEVLQFRSLLVYRLLIHIIFYPAAVFNVIATSPVTTIAPPFNPSGTIPALFPQGPDF